MTNILIIDDNDTKASDISAVLSDRFSEGLELDRHTCVSDGIRALTQKQYDLIVLDLVLPPMRGGEPIDVSEQIVDAVRQSEHNVRSQVIALSAFDDVVEARRLEFSEAGIVLIHYSDVNPTWRDVLDVICQRVDSREVCTFLIVCALPMERQSYQYTDASLGPLIILGGLDCLRLKVGDYRGICVLLPRMGIVDAAAVTARAIELFSPRVVAMSGICAGFSARSKIGDVVCVDNCWEHQAGKWSGPNFKLEEYQMPLNERLRTLLRQEIEQTDSFKTFRESIPAAREDQTGTAHIGPLVSGSAVIASNHLQEMIADQHKRLLGLDMEVYGVSRACHLAQGNVDFFAVKTVVDLADEEKNDRLQAYGSTLSAKIVVHMLGKVLA
ncbi:hypothetical protein [Mesorhizobium sp. CAU 1741]|uniref:phosphorylase family protein n=1 Tax=Mesorhizobium sp. CAU 1741 TaxID=3140366 RepID=UPI00325B588D